jgi:antitoxin component YwqK of YwqJK toxin-antitoxin module
MGVMLRTALSALPFLLFAAPALSVQDCEMNGEHVNPANGSTYAGKTGIMKCRDRDSGKLVSEEEYRNGRAIGYRKSVDMYGNTTVGNFNENRNRDGEFRQYDPAGVLVSEERYANGQSSGLQTYFHKNGKIRRRAFAEPGKGSIASLEYNDRGELTQVRCADRPVLGDDRKLCGFDGPAEVALYNAKGEPAGRVRHENGKRMSMTALGAAGKPAASEEVQGERRTVREYFAEGPLRLETIVVGKLRESEREFAKSSQRIRETRWNEGYKAEEALWYLNGQPKSKTTWERQGNVMIVKSDDYWDNGKLRARSVRDERRGPVGLQQTWTEAGALASESTYESGKLVRRKTYKDGQLVSDDEYFEDGSRKSVAR